MSIPVPATILAATAMEEEWDAVLPTAAELARSCGATLHVLHVVETATVQRLAGGMADQQRAAAGVALRTLLQRMLGPAADGIHLHLQSGDARRHVLETLQATAADLLVTAGHHGSGIAAHLFGTTAEAVARDAHRPCLIVRDRLRLPVKRIGIPTDLSEPSVDALRLVAGWGACLSGGRADARTSTGVGDDGRLQVHYVHVGWPVERADNPHMEAEVVRPRMSRDVTAVLGNVEQDVAVHIEVLWADEPVEAIGRWVRTRDVELLVVGMHGWHGARRMLLGSDAARLARELPCAVLLVPRR